MSCWTVHEMQPQSCSVAAVLFTAIGISFVAIALHGSLRVPDDLFTDEVEVGTALYASFCDGCQSSPAIEWVAPADMTPPVWGALQLRSRCSRGGVTHSGHMETSQNHRFACILRHMSSHRLRQLTLWHF